MFTYCFLHSLCGNENITFIASMDGHAEECQNEPVGSVWECIVCGQKNRKEGKYNIRLCVICGRHGGTAKFGYKDRYMGTKKLQVLGKGSVDLTPHLTVATRDELAEAKAMEKRRAQWSGYEGKRSLFLSNGADYEAIGRAEVKDEAAFILASIRTTLENE